MEIPVGIAEETGEKEEGQEDKQTDPGQLRERPTTAQFGLIRLKTFDGHYHQYIDGKQQWNTPPPLAYCDTTGRRTYVGQDCQNKKRGEVSQCKAPFG